VRDPARIDEVLALLREAWLRSPDLRLGQLIYNVLQPGAGSPWLYYVEDDILADLLKKCLTRREGP
jgi:uncharacterized protein YihD (DUF1040 family)